MLQLPQNIFWTETTKLRTPLSWLGKESLKGHSQFRVTHVSVADTMSLNQLQRQYTMCYRHVQTYNLLRSTKRLFIIHWFMRTLRMGRRWRDFRLSHLSSCSNQIYLPFRSRDSNTHKATNYYHWKSITCLRDTDGKQNHFWITILVQFCRGYKNAEVVLRHKVPRSHHK